MPPLRGDGVADLLLANGLIRTMDPGRPVARSIACSGGLVDSLDENPAAKRTVDLRGRTVVPGFIDAHARLLEYGLRKSDAAPSAFLAAQRDAIQSGITGVHDAGVDDEYLRVLRSLAEGRSLRLRVNALYRNPDPDRTIAYMRSAPPSSGRLTARSVIVTGSVDRVARVALETGHQICVDGANELPDAPEDARWRIEHAERNRSPSGRWIASIQPPYGVKPPGRLALGSDAPEGRLDPRWTFHGAVAGGLTPEEALRGMTADAAYAGFMEGGVLAPGRPADMAVLSIDWLTAPDQVLESEALATLMDGRVAYRSKSL